MIRRILEAVFRHKLLLLVPPLMIPALALAPVLLSEGTYATKAGVWVERPLYLATVDDRDGFVTPAQRQVDRLGELLLTRGFRADVARRSPLADLADTPAGDRKLEDMITEGLTFFPLGRHLIVLEFRAADGDVSYGFLKALTEAFREKVSSDRVRQGRVAISFWETRLQEATDETAKAREAYNQYLLANPDLLSRDSAPILIDPKLTDLQRRMRLAENAIETATAALEQARLDLATSGKGDELGFQVIDEPRKPTAPSRRLRDLLLFPAAGTLVGVALSAVLLVVLVATDRAVRAEPELAGRGTVLGTVPLLRPEGFIGRQGREAVRRAVGFIAGSAVQVKPRARLVGEQE